jgi:hypothetical protein
MKDMRVVAVARPMPEEVPVITMTSSGTWVWRCRFEGNLGDGDRSWRASYR